MRQAMILNPLFDAVCLLVTVISAAATGQPEPAEADPQAMPAAPTKPEAQRPAPKPASQGPVDRITLSDGRAVSAPILKETAEFLWLDMGFDVLQIPRGDVESVERAQVDESGVETRSIKDLFRTAERLPERTPKELSRRFGGAVIKVQTPGGLGSGFIIDPAGYAITNAHVVQGERRIKVTVYEQGERDFRLRIYENVELIAVNNHIDLALIQIKPSKDEPAVEFPYVMVQGAEDLAAGQDVFAIGSPLGLERTLSRGVVSTTQRSFEGLSYIQTDTQINPGNSGGPLFNLRGEVIGVTNMGIPLGEGLNFAIPARYVKDFVRNRDAFAFDAQNPNAGYQYNEPPTRSVFMPPAALDDASAP